MIVFLSEISSLPSSLRCFLFNSSCTNDVVELCLPKKVEVWHGWTWLYLEIKSLNISRDCEVYRMRVDPNVMTAVLVRRPWVTEWGRPSGDGGRGCSDSVRSQGILGTIRSWKRQETINFMGIVALSTPWFQTSSLQKCKTTDLLSTQLAVLCYCCPQKLTQASWCFKPMGLTCEIFFQQKHTLLYLLGLFQFILHTPLTSSKWTLLTA